MIPAEATVIDKAYPSVYRLIEGKPALLVALLTLSVFGIIINANPINS